MSSYLNATLRVCMFINLMLFAIVAVSTFFFPYGVDYGEAPLIDQARRIMKGQVLYKDNLNEPPYVISNYPPIYPFAIAIIGIITRIPIFQAGRMISILATLVSAWIIGSMSYRLTKDKTTGMIAAILFLGHPYIIIWSSLARVDSLALMFSLMGLWILFDKWHSWKWLSLATLCLAASTYTRQTFMLAAPLASSLWLWRNNHRRFFYFVISFAIICVSSFALMNFYTHGGFYVNTIIANINVYDISRTLVMTNKFLLTSPIVIVLAAITLLYTMLSRFTKKYRESNTINQVTFPFTFYYLVLYSTGALAVAFTVGKIGSGINYFMELITSTTLLTACASPWLSNKRIFNQTTYIALLIVQFIWLFIGNYYFYQTNTRYRWQKLDWYNERYMEVQAAITRGPVLSDDYLDLVVLSGQQIYYQPFEYGQLFSAGLWDPENMATEIEAQKFPLIIIGGDTIHKECCWPPALTESIEGNYDILTHLDISICRPKREH